MSAQEAISVESTAAPTSSSSAELGIISPLEIIHIAWEGVVRNKIRSLLTMLGVIIGVAAVIIMIAISAGTEATIAEQIEGLGANLVFIQASFGRGGPGVGATTAARSLFMTMWRLWPISLGSPEPRWSSLPNKRSNQTAPR